MDDTPALAPAMDNDRLFPHRVEGTMLRGLPDEDRRALARILLEPAGGGRQTVLAYGEWPGGGCRPIAGRTGRTVARNAAEGMALNLWQKHDDQGVADLVAACPRLVNTLFAPQRPYLLTPDLVGRVVTTVLQRVLAREASEEGLSAVEINAMGTLLGRYIEANMRGNPRAVHQGSEASADAPEALEQINQHMDRNLGVGERSRLEGVYKELARHLCVTPEMYSPKGQGILMGMLVAGGYKFAQKVAGDDARRCHYLASVATLVWAIGGICAVGSIVAACVVASHVVFTHVHDRPNLDAMMTEYLGLVGFQMLNRNVPPKALSYMDQTIRLNGIRC